MPNGDHSRNSVMRAEAAEKDLRLNAKMLAKQCDMAREAEIGRMAAEARVKELEEELRKEASRHDRHHE